MSKKEAPDVVVAGVKEADDSVLCSAIFLAIPRPSCLRAGGNTSIEGKNLQDRTKASI